VLVQRGWVTVPGVEHIGSEPHESSPPPPPEPLPLGTLPMTVSRWQIPYLIVAFLLCILLLALPHLAVLAQSSTNLLTDAATPRAGPAMVRTLPRWEQRTPLPGARSRLITVGVGNRIYAIGGEDENGNAVHSVVSYDLSINDWEPVAPLPAALANASATVIGNQIYVAGGSQNGDAPGVQVLSDKLYRYDTLTNQWQEARTLPYPVAGAALVADGSLLYLIGGWDGQKMRDEIWRTQTELTLGDTTWERVGHLSKARAFLGAAPVGSEIYLAGGFDGQRELDLVEVFDPELAETRQLPSMGEPRGGLVLLGDGLALYALGGGWTGSLTTHERFDLISETWSNFPSPIGEEWRNLGAAAVDGKLHLLGGWSGAPLDSHLEYQSSFRALLPVISNDEQ
jgi:hypothetical protein